MIHTEHIIIKLLEEIIKERLLKAARVKCLIIYKGSSKTLTPNFLSETIEARRQWDDIFKVLKQKKCQPRILYVAKLFFTNEEAIKTFAYLKGKKKKAGVLYHHTCP